MLRSAENLRLAGGPHIVGVEEPNVESSPAAVDMGLVDQAENRGLVLALK